jgi:S1-C subfamily serine protease
MARGEPSRRGRLRGRLLGDERHMGLWIFPLFVMAALLGAVLIGGLATLYYGQQVSDLEATTAKARKNLDDVVDDVSTSGTKARRAINKQVNQARDEFSRQSPVESSAKAGVYAVTATHADGEVRVGSAFTVFSNNSETFLITTYSLVSTDDGGAVELVEVFLPDQTVKIPVHSFDAERDLSVLVAEGGPLPVMTWRPAEEPVRRGDAVYSVGVAGPNTPAVLEGRVAGVSDVAVIPDIALNDFMAGGPLVDGSGRVVAIASQGYAPFGDVEGTLVYAPPIRLVCEVLIDCTASDLGAKGGEGAGGG